MIEGTLREYIKEKSSAINCRQFSEEIDRIQPNLLIKPQKARYSFFISNKKKQFHHS